MDRQIRKGDIAVVRTPTGIQEYFVTRSEPNTIYIKNASNSSILRRTGRGWITLGPGEVIEFRPGPGPIPPSPPLQFTKTIPPLELPEELNFETLLRLDYPSILAFCQLNRQAYLLCRDDQFWRLLVERDFPGLTQYKPSNESFRQQYEHLRLAEDPLEEVENGRLDGLMLLRREEVEFSEDVPDEAAERGYLNILNWLEQIGLLPSIHGASGAATKGHVDVLDWLAQREIFPMVEALEVAAGNGLISVLDWADRHNIPLTQNIANFAASEGRLDVLKWLESKLVLPNEDGAEAALDNGFVDTVGWLAQRNILPMNRLTTQLNQGDTSLLRWFIDSGYLPLQEAADIVAGTGPISLLEELKERGVLPTSGGAVNAAMKQRIDILDWLADQGIYPLGFIGIHPFISFWTEGRSWLARRGLINPEDYRFPQLPQ